jgi:hypothetical protein
MVGYRVRSSARERCGTRPRGRRGGVPLRRVSRWTTRDVAASWPRGTAASAPGSARSVQTVGAAAVRGRREGCARRQWQSCARATERANEPPLPLVRLKLRYAVCIWVDCSPSDTIRVKRYPRGAPDARNFPAVFRTSQTLLTSAQIVTAHRWTGAGPSHLGARATSDAGFVSPSQT